MKDRAAKRISVSIRLTPEEHAALRVEAARLARSGCRFDKSAVVSNALRAAPWFAREASHEEEKP